LIAFFRVSLQRDNILLRKKKVMPKITVLMPVYNGEMYLREAMESILQQKHADYEFLIIDDGSTDRSNEIINSYNDPRIRVLRNPRRLKLSGALNRGIDEAAGEFIARMDADDISLPARLAKQLGYLESNPTVGVCGTWVKRFGQFGTSIDKNPIRAEQIKAYTLFECPFSHPTVMLRKSMINMHKLRYNGEYYPTEDYELWSRAVDCFPCANLGEVLLEYRVHGNSMTGSDWNEMDAKGARIAGFSLEKLGMKCSESEIRFHRNIGRAASYRCSSTDQLDDAERWLHKLHAVNRQKDVYDQEALLDILSLVWFRLCFNSSPLGFPAFSKYLAAKWLLQADGTAKRISLLFLSIVKNSVVRPVPN